MRDLIRSIFAVVLCFLTLLLYGCSSLHNQEQTESEPEMEMLETSDLQMTEGIEISVPANTDSTEVPTEHVHEYVEEIVEPACVENGYTLYSCVCGDSYTIDETEALGHDVRKWKTVSQSGIDIKQEGVCSRCSATSYRETLDYPSGNYTAGTINGSYMSQDELDACARKIYKVTGSWGGKSNYQKAKAAYDYLQNNVSYADDIPNNSSNLYGAMINGRADCWGYATAYQYLCQALGLKCYFVRATNAMHAWNIVGIDGKYYHVDAQAGLFLVSDSSIGFDYNKSKYPSCNESYFGDENDEDQETLPETEETVPDFEETIPDYEETLPPIEEETLPDDEPAETVPEETVVAPEIEETAPDSSTEAPVPVPDGDKPDSDTEA